MEEHFFDQNNSTNGSGQGQIRTRHRLQITTKNTYLLQYGNKEELLYSRGRKFVSISLIQRKTSGTLVVGTCGSYSWIQAIGQDW